MAYIVGGGGGGGRGEGEGGRGGGKGKGKGRGRGGERGGLATAKLTNMTLWTLFGLLPAQFLKANWPMR